MTAPPIETQYFNMAQTFFLDPDVVKGAKKVGISAVDLYFKSKPRATGNKSGIGNPGVVLFITKTDPDKTPDVEPLYYGRNVFTPARVQFADIETSSDASRPTRFEFDPVVEVETGKEYCFLIRFEGNEDFVLWTSKQNDILLGTNKPSPGPSGKYTGNLYTDLSYKPSGDETTAATSKIKPQWKFLSDTDLKFKVFVARYAINGVLVGNNTVSSTLSVDTNVRGTRGANNVKIEHGSDSVKFHLSSSYYEYVIYDKKNSKAEVKGGEYVYQNTVFQPGGSATPVTVAVVAGNNRITANSLWPNGQAFNWNSIYGSSNTTEYIVVVSLNDDEAGKRKTDIREVESIESNTVLIVSEEIDFSNNAAYFIKSPVARVNFLDEVMAYDKNYKVDGSQKKRRKQDLLVLKKSNANATHRFVNNTINSISISASGGGYTNSDVLFIYGFENSAKVKRGYPAIANIVANATGNITAVYLSNVGAGFVNTANVHYIIANSSSYTAVTNSSSNTSAGSGATFSITEGTVLRTEFDGSDKKGGFFSNCDIFNIEVSDIVTTGKINNPSGTQFNIIKHTPYFMVVDPTTYLGVAYYVNDDVTKNKVEGKLFKRTPLESKNISVIPSRSNEFVIVSANTGEANIVAPPPGSNVTINAISNNDFVCVQPDDVTISYSRFNINNDYSGEHTNYGNAESKHITKKVTFENDRFAEDLVVYLNAYRPYNTDIKVYARIHNSNDSEPFDDKDWTLLQLINDNIYSSSADKENYVELTYSFQKHPNSQLRIDGTVNVADNTTVNVIGSGTSFSTNAIANLQVNDLIKIYTPLFPNNYAVCVVSAVANDTQFSITRPIKGTNSGNDITGDGLVVHLLGRMGNSTFTPIGYPKQAFNNQLNQNVVRYYTSSMIEYDTYDSFQLKVVLLADLDQVSTYEGANSIPTNIPRVDDIRAVGVTS